MKKRIVNLAIAVVGALGTLLLAAPAPKAHASWHGTCPTGTLCAFNGFNGTGTRWVLPFSTWGSGACNELTGVGDLSWTSLTNDYGDSNQRYFVRLYASPGCNGDFVEVYAPSSVNLGNLTPGFDNRATSMQTIPVGRPK